MIQEIYDHEELHVTLHNKKQYWFTIPNIETAVLSINDTDSLFYCLGKSIYGDDFVKWYKKKNGADN